jgi:uncharacterized protein YbjT (DUF2867 family)
VRVLIFGATGMVGSGVLLEALGSSTVSSVVVVGRKPTGTGHPKLEETLHDDFFDLDAVRDRLVGIDACFFCLGVSSAGMNEAEYHRLTYALTIAAARALLEASPASTFCYVSGSGTDSSERGRWMWARVKGKTENALLGMPFKAAYMFRPAFIQPLKGVRSKTRLYAILYALAAPVAPILTRVAPSLATDSTTLGRAMLRVAAEGFERPILESRDINRLGRATPHG